MGYTMYKEMKDFLLELHNGEFRNVETTLQLDRSLFTVRGLGLEREYIRWGPKEGDPEHRLTINDELGRRYSFPIHTWHMTNKRMIRGGPDVMRLSFLSGQTEVELYGVVISRVLPQHARSKRHLYQDINNLTEQLTAAQNQVDKLTAELAQMRQERDAARYEKLQIEGTISNLRGDLKNLLGL